MSNPPSIRRVRCRPSGGTCLTITCPWCDHVFEVDVTPPTPETGRHGPPEGYDPGDGGEIAPEECPQCWEVLDRSSIFEQAADQLRDREEAAAEARYDAWREDQMLNRE